jgi:hypothetical protein
MSGLLSQVLLYLLFGGVLPRRVCDLILQSSFSLLEFLDNDAVVSAAPVRRCRAGARQGQFLATVALEGDVGRMPAVAPAKRGFGDLVTPFNAYNNVRHYSILPAAWRDR